MTRRFWKVEAAQAAQGLETMAGASLPYALIDHVAVFSGHLAHSIGAAEVRRILTNIAATLKAEEERQGRIGAPGVHPTPEPEDLRQLAEMVCHARNIGIRDLVSMSRLDRANRARQDFMYRAMSLRDPGGKPRFARKAIAAFLDRKPSTIFWGASRYAERLEGRRR